MATRGFLGIRNNKGLLGGRYNHFDSYYEYLGKEVLDLYFDGAGSEIINLTEGEEDKEFLQEGLWCEFGYVYNVDNDTLEIYRGLFERKQAFDKKEIILNGIKEDGKNCKKYYCHLIIIVDRKKHTKEQVLKAFEKFNKMWEEGIDEEDYPEREIIPLELPENYVPLV